MNKSVAACNLDFNIQATAALYSQLAGVLAGFAFAAFLYVISPARPVGTRWDAIPRLAVSSFTVLVLVSLSYALLAGETIDNDQAAMIEIVAAAGFISAGILLYQLMYQLVFEVEYWRSPVKTKAGRESVGALRFALAYSLPPTLLFTLWGGIDDYSKVRFSSGAPASLSAECLKLCVGISAALSVAIPASVLLVDKLMIRLPWTSRQLHYKNRRRKYRELVWLSRLAVLIGLLSTGASFYVSALPGDPEKCEMLSEWLPLSVLAVSLLFVAANSVHMVMTRWREVTNSAAEQCAGSARTQRRFEDWKERVGRRRSPHSAPRPQPDRGPGREAGPRTLRLGPQVWLGCTRAARRSPPRRGPVWQQDHATVLDTKPRSQPRMTTIP